MGRFYIDWHWVQLAWLAAGASALTVGLLRQWAFRRGFVDHPKLRGAHDAPVPRMGGWGIAVALATVLAVSAGGGALRLGVVLAIVFLTGLLDDYHPLPAWPKLAALSVAAMMAMYWFPVRAGVELPFLVIQPPRLVAGVVGAIGLVAFANFFNFMDGVNGMAGSSAVLYGLYIALLAARTHTNPELALGLAAGALGFLVWNLFGKVFLGDAGSLVLGFALALAVLRLPEAGAMTAAIIAMSVTIFDPVWTLGRRLHQGAALVQAHRSHLYQRLLGRLSHLQISAIYSCLTLACMLLGWFYLRDSGLGRLALLMVLALLLSSLVTAVGGQEALEQRPGLQRHLQTAVVLVVSALLLGISYVSSFALRFNLVLPASAVGLLLRTLPLVVALRLLALFPLRLQRGWWRYTSLADLMDLVLASALGGAACWSLRWWVGPRFHVPASVVLLDSILGICLLGGARLVRRALFELRSGANRGARTLIVGANEVGMALAREMRRDPAAGARPVGFVDETGGKLGLRLAGLPVVGSLEEVGTLCRTRAIEQILVATALPPARVRAMISACEQLRVRFRILPRLHHLLTGPSGLRGLRDLEVGDLLARDEVTMEMQDVAQQMEGATVMITGAAGSIGSELARLLVLLGTPRLVLLDRAESPLHDLECELRECKPDMDLHAELVDVRDRGDVERVFARWRPDVVYHCAAYKHVPLLEVALVLALRNNLLGTAQVLAAARASGCRRFVLISTDKAVNAVSVMGMTKRLCELMVASVRGETTACAVRFGNVLGSNGSVVPTFLRQLAANHPLTVTHSDITRYFMTVGEAVRLVVRAGQIAEQGEIFMLDMGEPVRILDLAQDLRALHTQRGGVPSPIVVTGLRAGEKLHEELHSSRERAVPSGWPKIFRLGSDAELSEEFTRLWPELRGAVEGGDTSAILALCARLVPTFSPAPYPPQGPAVRAAQASR